DDRGGVDGAGSADGVQPDRSENGPHVAAGDLRARQRRDARSGDSGRRDPDLATRGTETITTKITNHQAQNHEDYRTTKITKITKMRTTQITESTKNRVQCDQNH